MEHGGGEFLFTVFTEEEEEDDEGFSSINIYMNLYSIVGARKRKNRRPGLVPGAGGLRWTVGGPEDIMLAPDIKRKLTCI